MSFRSTFVIEDSRIVWPDWFREKYKNWMWFNPDGKGVFASQEQIKLEYDADVFAADIQRAVDWDARGPLAQAHDIPLMLVLLHECGAITRCRISRTHIQFSQPTGWRITDGIDHWDCSSCSKLLTPEEES